MKTNFTFSFLFLIVMNNISMAQKASGIPYKFSADTNLLSFPSVGMINCILPNSIRNDWDTLISPIGFNFNFSCEDYTKFIVSSNGWIALVPPNVSTNPLPYPSFSLPNNQLNSNTTGYPFFAPLWDDDSCILISYCFQSNVLFVRWFLKWDINYTGNYSSFPIVAFDGNTGKIEFYYSTSSYYAPITASASIGIAGRCLGDFYSVTPDTIVTFSSVDSLIENSSINKKPLNARFTFSPECKYDDCSHARFLGTIDSSCNPFPVSTCYANPNGNGNCGTSDNNDVWFSYFKPTGVSHLTIETSPPQANCASVSGTSIEVYLDSCGGPLVGCASTSLLFSDFASLSLSRPVNIAETLFVRVTADNDLPGKFNICAHLPDSSNGFKDLQKNFSFIIYPNPIHEKEGVTFLLNNVNEIKGTIEIVDLRGMVLFTKEVLNNNSTIELNEPELLPGIYFIRIKNGNIIQNGRLVVE